MLVGDGIVGFGLQEYQEVIAEAMQLEEYEAGQAIYKQGDVGECFYLIHEGTVGLKKAEAGAVQRLGPKAYFGESALRKAEKRFALQSNFFQAEQNLH